MILINHTYKIPFCEQRRMGIVVLLKGISFFILGKILFYFVDIEATWINTYLYIFVVMFVVYKFLRIHYFCFLFGENTLTIYCGIMGKMVDRVPYKRINNIEIKKGKRCISVLKIHVKKDHEEIGLLDSVSFILGCTQKKRMYELYMVDSHAESARTYLEERI